jgi:hypothetical protein
VPAYAQQGWQPQQPNPWQSSRQTAGTLARLRPARPAAIRNATLWAAVATALLGALLLGDGLGPNLLIVAVPAALAAYFAAQAAGRRLRSWSAVWAAGGLALLAVPALRDAGWPVFLAVVSAVALGSLTLHGSRSWLGVFLGSVCGRWPSKEDLVAEALQAALPAIGEAPDCGSIRENLYQLGRRLRDAMLSTPGTALLSVLHECDSSASGRFQAVIFQGVIQPSTELFRKVVSRGVERGDVRSDATSDLALDVIPAMMMYRSKVCSSEWLDVYIAELIDQIMVPLLRPSGS